MLLLNQKNTVDIPNWYVNRVFLIQYLRRILDVNEMFCRPFSLPSTIRGARALRTMIATSFPNPTGNSCFLK